MLNPLCRIPDSHCIGWKSRNIGMQELSLTAWYRPNKALYYKAWAMVKVPSNDYICVNSSEFLLKDLPLLPSASWACWLLPSWASATVLCGWRASQSQSLSGGGLLRLAETVLLLATAGVLLRASPCATASFLESKCSQGASPSFGTLQQLLLLLETRWACSKALTAAMPVNNKSCGVLLHRRFPPDSMLLNTAGAVQKWW